MIAKKNKKANLERKRFAFFQIGLLVSGSLCLAAFEYSTVVPDEYRVVLDDEGFGSVETVYEDQLPEDPKPQKEQPRIVNYENVDSFDIKKELTNQNQAYVSYNANFINMGDMGDPFGDDFNWDIVPEDGDPLILSPDRDPSFVGGEAEMFKWLHNEINYPQMCAEMGIQGLVYIQFEVSKSGAISKVTPLKSPHEDLTNEAMRVVKKMPKWIPGEQAGKAVRTRFTLPVNFVLY
jgi:protein TonB